MCQSQNSGFVSNVLGSGPDIDLVFAQGRCDRTRGGGDRWRGGLPSQRRADQGGGCGNPLCRTDVVHAQSLGNPRAGAQIESRDLVEMLDMQFHGSPLMNRRLIRRIVVTRKYLICQTQIDATPPTWP